MSEECWNCKKSFIGIGYTFDGKYFDGKGCLVKYLQETDTVKMVILK